MAQLGEDRAQPSTIRWGEHDIRWGERPRVEVYSSEDDMDGEPIGNADTLPDWAMREIEIHGSGHDESDYADPFYADWTAQEKLLNTLSRKAEAADDALLHGEPPQHLQQFVQELILARPRMPGDDDGYVLTASGFHDRDLDGTYGCTAPGWISQGVDGWQFHDSHGAAFIDEGEAVWLAHESNRRQHRRRAEGRALAHEREERPHEEVEVASAHGTPICICLDMAETAEERAEIAYDIGEVLAAGVR